MHVFTQVEKSEMKGVLCPFSHMYTSPAEKVLPTGYICTGMMCAHVVLAAESPLVSGGGPLPD